MDEISLYFMFKARHKLNQELEFSDHSYFYLQCAKVYGIIEIKEFELFFSAISTEKQNKLFHGYNNFGDKCVFLSHS